MRRLLLVVVAGAIAVSACGKSEQQKQAEEAAKQVEAGAKQVAKAADDAAKEVGKGADQAAKGSDGAASEAAKGFEAMAKGLGAMVSGGTGDMKPVDPVSFRDLMALFPTLDGWEKSKPTGEKMTSPFRYSNAEVTYTKGNANIELKLADSGFNQLLFAPFALLMQAGYEKETQSGYEKSTKIGDQPAYEKWNTDEKSGEITTVINKRFLMSAEGRHLDDIKTLRDAVTHVDVAKLAAMK
jgi:hypothetical protein